MAVPPRPPAFELSSQDTNDSSETAHPPVKLPLKRKAPAEMDEHISELPSVAAQLSFDVHAKQALHETTATFGNIVADEEDAYGADIIKASEAFVAVLGTQAEPLVNDLLAHIKRGQEHHANKTEEFAKSDEDMRKDLEKDNRLLAAARAELAAALNAKSSARKRFKHDFDQLSNARMGMVNAQIDRHSGIMQEVTAMNKSAAKLPSRDQEAVELLALYQQKKLAAADGESESEYSDGD